MISTFDAQKYSIRCFDASQDRPFCLLPLFQFPRIWFQCQPTIQSSPTNCMLQSPKKYILDFLGRFILLAQRTVCVFWNGQNLF